jgi:hypothetical protein
MLLLKILTFDNVIKIPKLLSIPIMYLFSFICLLLSSSEYYHFPSVSQCDHIKFIQNCNSENSLFFCKLLIILIAKPIMWPSDVFIKCFCNNLQFSAAKKGMILIASLSILFRRFPKIKRAFGN